MDARLESHDTESFVRRFAFNPREDRPAESLASSRRRDIHALHFTVIRSNTQRAAGEWRAIAPRSEYAALAASRKLKPVGDVAGAWSITCYFVAKEHRRTGLMGALLAAAARHARRKGARVLEGYPVLADSLAGCAGYTGLVPAYKRAGFKVVARPNAAMRVMQKAL